MKNLKNIFLILIFISPFFRGLYFYHELFIITAILLLLFSTAITRNGYVKIPWDFNMFIYSSIVLLYMISIIFSVDRGMALIGFLRILSYLCLYFLYVQLYTDEFKSSIIYVFIYSGVAGVLISICGYVLQNYIGMWIIQNNRLGGIFQYANSYAAYCLIIFILILEKDIKSRIDYIGLVSLIVGIILTFSRTCYILLIFTIAIIYIFGKRNRVLILYSSLIGVILSWIMIYFFGNSNVGNRILQSSIKSSELQTRFLYYIDGIKMIKRFPLGLGHLGYYYIQRAYQTGSTYFIKYIHNSLLQIMLDIGIIGGLLFVFYFAYNYRKFSANKYYQLIFIVVLFHSLLDFDFEFPYIIFILLILAGVNKDKIIYYKGVKAFNVAICIGWGIYIYLSIVTCLNYFSYYNKTLKLYPYYTEAGVSIIKQDHNYSESTLDISNRIINRNSYSIEAFAYNRDYYYNKYNIQKKSLSSVKNNNENLKYQLINYLDTAKYYGELTLNLNKLNIKHIEDYSNILLTYSQEYIEDKQFEKANELLYILVDIPYYIQQLKLSYCTELNVRHKPYFVMTDRLKRNYEKAVQLLMQTDKDLNINEVN